MMAGISVKVNSENNDLNDVQCPESIVGKGEEIMDLDFIIKESQNKLFLLKVSMYTI